MAKFTWKGKSLEELRAMPLEEYRNLVPSKLRRSLKRGFTGTQKAFLEKVKANPGKLHKTKSRGLVIIPELIGVKIGVHDGKEYIPVEIRPEMLGHRLGEFAPTRKKVQHSAPGFGATKSSKFVPLK
jgi:small subunit ribosomal protein S19